MSALGTELDTPLFKMKWEYIFRITLRKGLPLENKVEEIFGILNQLEEKDIGHDFVLVYQDTVICQKYSEM